MWYDGDKWGGRLLVEQQLMHSRFPGFWLVRTSGGELRWVGVLEPITGHDFLVSLRYPSSYPYKAPSLFVEEPPIRAGTPHLYADGSLCVHKQQWNPETGTAVGCVPLISAWLTRYLNWLDRQEF